MNTDLCLNTEWQNAMEKAINYVDYALHNGNQKSLNAAIAHYRKVLIAIEEKSGDPIQSYRLTISATSPSGLIPRWGEPGVFEIAVDEVKALVSVSALDEDKLTFTFFNPEGQEFFSPSLGYVAIHYQLIPEPITVDQVATRLLAKHLEKNLVVKVVGATFTPEKIVMKLYGDDSLYIVHDYGI